jgi:hypothetical protein
MKSTGWSSFLFLVWMKSWMPCPATEFTNFLTVHHKIRDEYVHRQFQDYLLEHTWTAWLERRICLFQQAGPIWQDEEAYRRCIPISEVFF